LPRRTPARSRDGSQGLGGTLVCQKDSFLCAARGVSIGIAFQRKIGVGLFGGEGFIMQKLEGDGLCFVHAGGTIHNLDLAAGETLRVDTGCLVALQPSVATTTSSSSARSRPRCSAGKASSSRPSPARVGSGCSRCRSAAWPIASTRPLRRRVAAERKRVRYSTGRSAWAT
jgi:hypothetical protein